MNDVTSIFPEIVFEYNKSFIFGIVKINITVEDRKAVDKARNYKHIITIKVFTKEFNIVIKSPSIGHYNMDNNCITDYVHRKHW